MLSLNIVNIYVRWSQNCRTLAVGNKIISSEKNAQPHLKNGFRNARGYRYGSYIKIKPEIQIWWLYSFIQSYLAVSGGAGATKSSARSRSCIIYFHTYQIYKKYNKFWTYQMMYEVISLSLVNCLLAAEGQRDWTIIASFLRGLARSGWRLGPVSALPLIFSSAWRREYEEPCFSLNNCRNTLRYLYHLAVNHSHRVTRWCCQPPSPAK